MNPGLSKSLLPHWAETGEQHQQPTVNATGAWTSSSGSQRADKGYCLSLAITPSVLSLERQFTQQCIGQVLGKPTQQEVGVISVNEELNRDAAEGAEKQEWIQDTSTF